MIDEISIRWGANHATGYEIDLSNDGSAWTTVFSTSNGDGDVDTIMLGGLSAQYVRMMSTAWSDNSLRNWVREFEVRGSQDSTAPTSTPTPTNTPTPTSTPTPTPTATLPSSGQGTMHVGDLDGSSQRVGKNWKADVTITVHDNNEAPLADVIVNGAWSGGFSGSASCKTDTSGQCKMTSGRINDNQQGSVSFTVDDLSLASYSYQPADNHDQEGDSNGSAISVSKP